LKTATSHVARIKHVYNTIVVIHNVGVEKHNAKQSDPDAFQANSAKLKTLLFLGMLADLAALQAKISKLKLSKNPPFTQG
jgi:hypothetical protein